MPQVFTRVAKGRVWVPAHMIFSSHYKLQGVSCWQSTEAILHKNITEKGKICCSGRGIHHKQDTTTGVSKKRERAINKRELLLLEHRTVGLQQNFYHTCRGEGGFMGTITNSANPFQRTVLEQVKQDPNLPKLTTSQGSAGIKCIVQLSLLSFQTESCFSSLSDDKGRYEFNR